MCLQVAGGAVVALLGQLWGRGPDQDRALPEGLRGWAGRGRSQRLPRRGQETRQQPAVQPAALRRLERHPLGTGEFSLQRPPVSGASLMGWGAVFQCQGPCVGPGRATRHRHLYCQLASGAKASERTCSGLPR